MTTATLTKSSTLLTPELASQVVAMRCIVRIAQTAEGVEIRDTRPLINQMEAPIGGTGVVRYFGSTHFIVTEAKARSLNAKPLATTP